MSTPKPSAKRPTVSSSHHSLNKLQNSFSRKLIGQRQRLEKVNRYIDTTQRKITDLKKQIKGVRSYEVHSTIQKQIYILENRLNKMSVRNSEATATNKYLKGVINSLRRERQTFNEVYRRLQQEFSIKQQEMTSIISASNAAFDSREKAEASLADIKSTNATARRAFDEEFVRLSTVVEEQARVNDYVKLSALKRKEKTIVEQVERGDLSPAEEQRLKDKLKKLNKRVHERQHTQQSNVELERSYENAFKKLRDTLGEDDLQVIVNTFIEKEDANFSLFNHIQGIKNDCDDEERELHRCYEEMEKYRSDEGEDGFARKRIKKKEKKEKAVAVLKTKNQEVAQRLELSTNTVGALCGASVQFFKRIKCSAMVVEQEQARLGSPGAGAARAQSPAARERRARRIAEERRESGLGEHVDQHNIMLHLGIIEQRVNEIVQQYRQHSLSTLGGGDAGNKHSMPGPPVPCGVGSRKHIEMPEDDSDDSRDVDEDTVQDMGAIWDRVLENYGSRGSAAFAPRK